MLSTSLVQGNAHATNTSSQSLGRACLDIKDAAMQRCDEAIQPSVLSLSVTPLVPCEQGVGSVRCTVLATAILALLGLRAADG
jgi:hypothetical protein